MAIGGYETPVVYGHTQIFDPTMAAMVLDVNKRYGEALKAEYERGLKDFEDFSTKYGDFISPFSKDMKRYGEMMGNIKLVIDQAYANGIDLTRSPEGRLLISRMTHSIDPGEYNNMRANAKLGYTYLEALLKAIADDEFDPDYEDWLLLQEGGPGRFLDFSSAGGKVWNRPAPGKFLDTNKWTHHLFDDMELSFDPELSKKYPGYLAYTKSRDTMNTIVDNNIAGLLNTNQGKYKLHQLMSSGMNYDLAVEALKKHIVDSNWEENKVKLETDPYYYARYQASLAPRTGSGGSGSLGKGKEEYNYLTGVFQRGITIPFGYDRSQGEKAILNITKNLIAFGQSLIPQGNPAMTPWQAYKSKATAYVNRFTTYESPGMFGFAISRPVMNKMGGVYMTPGDVSRLHTSEDVVTNTYGYTNKHIATDTRKIPNPTTKKNPNYDASDPESQPDIITNVLMLPYEDVYTSYRKSGSIESQWKVKLIDPDTGKSYGDYWYDLPIGSESNADVPKITEWTYSNKTGNAYAPKDKKGNERGQAKVGVNPKIGGMYERSSQLTNKAMGVTKNIFSGNIPYTEESISNY